MTLKEEYRKTTDKWDKCPWSDKKEIEFLQDYIKWLEAKLTLTDVVICVCKIPEPRLKVSENGTYAYCNNCANTYWQK